MIFTRALALVAAFFCLITGSLAAAQTPDPGYVLGPDDSVQVIVYGQPEFGVTTRIKSDGTIVMPLLGQI